MEFFPENLCLRIRKTLPQILHQTPHVSRLAEFYHVLKTKSVSEILGGWIAQVRTQSYEVYDYIDEDENPIKIKIWFIRKKRRLAYG